MKSYQFTLVITVDAPNEEFAKQILFADSGLGLANAEMNIPYIHDIEIIETEMTEERN
jgi:hypothetical protein